jgi:hypothetical protein
MDRDDKMQLDQGTGLDGKVREARASSSAEQISMVSNPLIEDALLIEQEDAQRAGPRGYLNSVARQPVLLSDNGKAHARGARPQSVWHSLRFDTAKVYRVDLYGGRLNT